MQDFPFEQKCFERLTNEIAICCDFFVENAFEDEFKNILKIKRMMGTGFQANEILGVLRQNGKTFDSKLTEYMYSRDYMYSVSRSFQAREKEIKGNSEMKRRMLFLKKFERLAKALYCSNSDELVEALYKFAKEIPFKAVKESKYEVGGGFVPRKIVCEFMISLCNAFIKASRQGRTGTPLRTYTQDPFVKNADETTFSVDPYLFKETNVFSPIFANIERPMFLVNRLARFYGFVDDSEDSANVKYALENLPFTVINPSQTYVFLDDVTIAVEETEVEDVAEELVGPDAPRVEKIASSVSNIFKYYKNYPRSIDGFI